MLVQAGEKQMSGVNLIVDSQWCDSIQHRTFLNGWWSKEKQNNTKEQFGFAECGSTHMNWSRKPQKEELNFNEASVYSLLDCDHCDEKCT